MDNIKSFLRPMPAKKKATERGELLQFFIDEINKERKGTKYKPITFGWMNKLVQGLNKQDLYYLASICKDSKRRGNSFGSRFFWELKPKDEYAN